MKNTIVLSLFIILQVGCGNPVKFTALKSLEKKDKANTPAEDLLPYTDTFLYDYTPASETFRQTTYEANQTAIAFKALNSSGGTIPDLTKNDIQVFENGLEVKNYSFNSILARTGNDVDIVFSLDITSSMDSDINKVRESIRDFVDKLSKKKIRANLCISTFKDKVEKECSRFVEDDANTPENENLTAFLDELGKIKVGGGGYTKENSLGGLMAAAQKTPWHPLNQRMIVHVTDADFWIMPDDEYEFEARYAPDYESVVKALKNSKAIVFTVTPRMRAYTFDYDWYPSIPKMTNGQFFDLDKIRKRKLTMDDVFNKISQSIMMTYEVVYKSEENPGLDPTLPLSSRKIEVKLQKSSLGTVTPTNISSNMPSGHPDYLKEFALNIKGGINANSLKVYFDKSEVKSGFKVHDGKLIFATYPNPGTEISVNYEYLKLRDHFQIIPLELISNGNLSDINVLYNGMDAKLTDYEVHSKEGKNLFNPLDGTFDESDPYFIRSTGYLEVIVQYLSDN